MSASWLVAGEGLPVVPKKTWKDNGWPDALIGPLRALWDEGLSTAEIARRLGMSKNAVVGKAHRLQLPSRPSPIHRDGQPKPPKILRAPKTTLQPIVAPPAPIPPPIAVVVPLAAKSPIAAVATPVVAAPTSPPTRRDEPCCWPMWGTGKPTNIFCQAVAVRGSYCATHGALAYEKNPDK